MTIKIELNNGLPYNESVAELKAALEKLKEFVNSNITSNPKLSKNENGFGDLIEEFYLDKMLFTINY